METGIGDRLKSQYEGPGSDLATRAHVPGGASDGEGLPHIHEGPPEGST